MTRPCPAAARTAARWGVRGAGAGEKCAVNERPQATSTVPVRACIHAAPRHRSGDTRTRSVRAPATQQTPHASTGWAGQTSRA